MRFAHSAGNNNNNTETCKVYKISSNTELEAPVSATLVGSQCSALSKKMTKSALCKTVTVVVVVSLRSQSPNKM